MPEIDISKLATLDERDSAISAAADARFAPNEPRAAGRFAPPAELADEPLGVERSTRAIRIANQRELDAATVAARPPRLARPSPAPSGAAIAPRSYTGVLVGVLAILAVAAGLYVFARRAPSPPPAHAGVSIRIVAPAPTAITIDGHAAGKTPITLQRPRGARPITIAAPGFVREVTPDHDAVIDVGKP